MKLPAIKNLRIVEPACAYTVQTVSSEAFLKDYIEERVVEIANYIIDEKATVRQTAKRYGVSKSTVHKDVSERLKYINPRLYKEVKSVLELNKAQRHIRGGLATKRKYSEKREKAK